MIENQKHLKHDKICTCFLLYSKEIGLNIALTLKNQWNLKFLGGFGIANVGCKAKISFIQCTPALNLFLVTFLGRSSHQLLDNGRLINTDDLIPQDKNYKAHVVICLVTPKSHTP